MSTVGIGWRMPLEAALREAEFFRLVRDRLTGLMGQVPEPEYVMSVLPSYIVQECWMCSARHAVNAEHVHATHCERCDVSWLVKPYNDKDMMRQHRYYIQSLVNSRRYCAGMSLAEFYRIRGLSCPA